MQDLAVNGCDGVTCSVWQHVNTAFPQGSDQPQATATCFPGAYSSSALESLSCVGCKGLRSCFLGMLPGPSQPQEGVAGPQVQDWLPAVCHLSGLPQLDRPPHHDVGKVTVQCRTACDKVTLVLSTQTGLLELCIDGRSSAEGQRQAGTQHIRHAASQSHT